MADIRTALHSILSAAATLTARVGSGSDARIWRGKIQQNPELDSIAFEVFDSDVDFTHQGRTGLKQIYLIVDAFSQTGAGASSLQGAIEAVLAGYVGTVGSIQVQGIFPEREHDQYDQSVKSFRCSQVYRLWYGENVR